MSDDNNNNSKVVASVVLVGCGAPLKSMGWYHATQLLDESRNIQARLDYVVEPWFMSSQGESSPGAKEFQEFKSELESSRGVQFYGTVEEVPHLKEEDDDDGTKRLAIISARTADNPKLFQSCISIGCHAIFLEKPGAPSVSELESMAASAKSGRQVQVFMGFNKNVSNYVTKTRELEKQHSVVGKKVKVTYVHNNNYVKSIASLGECFERNSEGMLKNMAIHELALLVTYYNVSVSNIASVVADEEYSSCQTLLGPSSNKPFTDFDKLKFTIVTKDGVEVSIAADRCGGDDSLGIVTSVGEEAEELGRFSMPDPEDASIIANAEKKIGGAMPYFYVQDPDYCTLKQRVAKAVVEGDAEAAEGVASIEVAVETLKVAEYLTPILQKQLLKE